MKLTDAERDIVDRARKALDDDPVTTLFSPLWIEKLLGIIDRLSQEPEVVRAYWTSNGDCSHCSEPSLCDVEGEIFQTIVAARSDYCPHCGAQMDGERRKERDDG